MKALNTIKPELLAKPGTRAAYDAQGDEFALARELIAARTRAGLTQADVAQRMGTTQSMALVFTNRPADEPTERRIISLRKANSREVQRYAET